MSKKPKHPLPRIGIDLMGNDNSPEILLEAVQILAQELTHSAQLFVFADEKLIAGRNLPHLTLIPTKDTIAMHDNPLMAVRRKKEASLCVGMRMLQKKELDAFVTAGNTGALIALAKLKIPMLPHIDRPALMTLLPTKKNDMAVLDVGANINYKAEHLVQFAAMGIAYQKTRGIQNPSVGLLNIGYEEKKGTSEVREAYQKLQGFNRGAHKPFAGNLEARDAFLGNIDVLVTDGFTGNIFLKTAEGIASHIFDILDSVTGEECSENLKSKLSKLRSRLHYEEYPGGILCGVEGVIVKCHGHASAQSFTHSIISAVNLVQNDFIKKISTELDIVASKFSLTSIKKRLFDK